MNMNNMQRLQMEVKGVQFDESELTIYLQENNLTPTENYTPSSHNNKRAIYCTALSVLESLANNPEMMKNIKVDDMTVSEFHENLMKRIDQLEFKVRNMPMDNNDSGTDSSVFMLYV